MRASFLGAILVLGAASASELVVNVGLQTGSFLLGSDISGLNAHDYRPNEFVTSDVRQSTCSKPQTQPGKREDTGTVISLWGYVITRRPRAPHRLRRTARPRTSRA